MVKQTFIVACEAGHEQKLTRRQAIGLFTSDAVRDADTSNSKKLPAIPESACHKCAAQPARTAA